MKHRTAPTFAIPKPVVLLATRWGSAHGGLNTFNADLAIALANRTSATIYCVVLNASADDVADAQRQGICLVSLSSSNDQFPKHQAVAVAVAVRNAEAAQPSWIIGHDLITGPPAIELAAMLGARSAVIHHMNYYAYHNLKAPPVEVIARRDEQAALFARTDLLIAIGPRLVRSARELLRIAQSGAAVRVVELVPGLSDIEPLGEPPASMKAIVFGRLDRRLDKLKQTRLAVAAFATAVKAGTLGSEPSLTLVGLPSTDMAEMRRLADEHAQRYFQLLPLDFQPDRSKLFSLLREQSVAIVPSWHEGFGLVAWEAIAAGIPTILSSNTGAFDTLQEQHLEHLVQRVDIKATFTEDELNPHDIGALSEALRRVAGDLRTSKQNALQLRRELLRRGYTWSATADQVRLRCALPTREENSVVSIAIGKSGMAGGVELLACILFDRPARFETLCTEFLAGLRKSALFGPTAPRRLDPATDPPAYRTKVIEFISSLPFDAYVSFSAGNAGTGPPPMRKLIDSAILSRLRTKRHRVSTLYVPVDLHATVDHAAQQTLRLLKRTGERTSLEAPVLKTDDSVVFVAQYVAAIMLDAHAGRTGPTGLQELSAIQAKIRLIHDVDREIYHRRSDFPEWASELLRTP